MGAASHERIRRNAAPQPTQALGVNWANPLSHKLVYLANLGVGAIDATGIYHVASTAALSGSARFSNGRFGAGLELTGAASDYLAFTTSITAGEQGKLPSASSFNGTIEVLCSLSGAGTRTHLFGFSDTVPASGGVHRALIAFNGTGPCNIYAYDGAGGDVDSSVLYRADGSLQHIFFCWGKETGEATAGQKIYRDGAVIKSATATLTNFSGTAYVYFGSHIPTGTTTMTGHIYKAAVYTEKLTDAEVVALTADPWQQFQNFNTVRRAFAPPAAASGQPGRPYYDRFISRI